ncbi:MAG: NADH-quinone oxidoreductase subunit J [Planctomycetes bacterium]|nr:NADH-quinone oxidoreductase subunit J [Planctomycetota bacterium]
MAVAVSKNIVRSAFALLTVLFSAASFYAFMRADFIFAAQILIYVGGILVLIIFAIMLTHRITNVRLSNESAHSWGAFFACFCVAFALILIVATYRWSRVEKPMVAVVASQPPVRLALAMYQADGTTGVTRGGRMIDGHGVLVVDAPDLPGRMRTGAAARIRIEGPQTILRDVPFEPRGPEGHRARLELSGLPAGKYRWSVALAGEEPEAITPEVPAVDFVAERGLTKAIGWALMGRYLLPFEAVSVLLLAALIGAAFLARKEVKA